MLSTNCEASHGPVTSRYSLQLLILKVPQSVRSLQFFVHFQLRLSCYRTYGTNENLKSLSLSVVVTVMQTQETFEHRSANIQH